MDDFVAHNSRWRGALLVLGSLAFVVLGLWMTGAFGEPPSSRRYPAPLMIGIGWFTVLFFGVCGVAWVKRLFDESPQLYIGPSGIRWSPWSDQLIPWSEITDVTTWRVKGQNVILLHLRNPGRFPGRGLGAMLAAANRKLSGGDISISLTGTDRSYDDAMSAIGRFRE
jgi:hypothetical protein